MHVSGQSDRSKCDLAIYPPGCELIRGEQCIVVILRAKQPWSRALAKLRRIPEWCPSRPYFTTSTSAAPDRHLY